MDVKLDRCVPVSDMAHQTEKVLIIARRCRQRGRLLPLARRRSFAHGGGGRAANLREVPFDQFEISSLGEEPDPAGSLDGKGAPMADDVSACIAVVKATIGSSLTELHPILLGISQVLDCMQ